MAKTLQVALIGNPNTGKTSVFNLLTGLNQKVGNYPGITVEKKEGSCRLPDGSKARIIDLPGTYSLNAASPDEQIVVDHLMLKAGERPDVVVMVADAENLKRNLLLFSQVKDLCLPVILVINMADRMKRKGISIDTAVLETQFQTRVAMVSARKATGIDELKSLLVDYHMLPKAALTDFSKIDQAVFSQLQATDPQRNLYDLWLESILKQKTAKDEKQNDEAGFRLSEADFQRLQQKETIQRYLLINKVLKQGLKIDPAAAKGLRAMADRILTHRIGGYLIFFLIMLLVFQSIYNWSSYPMDWIDQLFATLSATVNNTMPEGTFTSLLAEGIIPGIGGVVIFIPQIAFLFLFISILEESGYMSRVVFLMDRIMRRFGLNGKSVVPLISGTACAIPAIMATRTIDNWKERLITILVTPFITCSARLPVYLIIIALVIPDQSFMGFNLQGLTLMMLYLLGFLMAIASAYVLNKLLKMSNRSFFFMEMPAYKMPLPKNVLITVVEKTKSFVWGAGRIILAISIILWFLASNGPGENFRNAEQIVTAQAESEQLNAEELDIAVNSWRLKHSYIGILGHAIEPAIAPLGYDWKLGIGLITSFAAREVFVGTLATIYSVGNDEAATIKEKMSKDINSHTGKPLFTFATGISLLLFYAFAMQCMSTLAIVKRETNSWRWPLIQLFFMSGFAYVVALAAYQLLK